MPKTYSSFVTRHGWLLLIIAAGIISLGASLINVRDAFAGVLPAGAVPALLVVLIGIAAAGIFVIASLRRQNRLLNAALDGMPQGVCMFDSSARLMLCNERYLEIYRLTAEQAKPWPHATRLARKLPSNGDFLRRHGAFRGGMHEQNCARKVNQHRLGDEGWPHCRVLDPADR